MKQVVCKWEMELNMDGKKFAVQYILKFLFFFSVLSSIKSQSIEQVSLPPSLPPKT